MFIFYKNKTKIKNEFQINRFSSSDLARKKRCF